MSQRELVISEEIPETPSTPRVPYGAPQIEHPQVIQEEAQSLES